MKKIFTLCLSAFIATVGMAQAPSGVFKKASVDPVVDGVMDDVWSEANVYTIDRVSEGVDAPTLGESGETTWRGLWSAEGVYVLLSVTDDAFYPAYEIPSDATWEYDKPELYFDCNYDLQDGVGPVNSGPGHHQFAPPFVQDKIDGTPITDNGVTYADVVDGSNYVAEYFIPYEKLVDRSGNIVDITIPVGFDVTIIDRDPGDSGRRNAYWANNSSSSSWDNMDNAGTITFEGAEPAIEITKITVSGETTITSDNGTVQLTAALEPLDATQAYKWIVTNETGRATVSKTGLVTGLRNGTVTVKAVSADEFISSEEITITISGQKISLAEVNMILNGNFENGEGGKESWTGGGLTTAVIEDSYLNVDCTPKVNIWDTMFGQPKLPVDGTTKYIVKFKAKASADMVVPTLMEDRTYSNNKTVTSSSPFREGEMWNIPVTTEAQWFEFDVVFSNIQENSAYELNFQVGMVTGILSIDSVMMYSEADFALVDPTAGLNTVDGSSLSVYPNPVNNTLFVELSDINAKVAIYNSVGQKLMEKTATRNRVQFDVSALRKGMYIVRLSDGTSRKFVK